jgi:hypothetical protein
MNLKFKLAFLRHNRNLFDLSERERLYWFFREQFRFGHREILLDYLGMSYDNLIVGFLQHGFHGAQLAPWQTQPKTLREFYPVFVWNSHTEQVARSQGFTHVNAIGAPWLYLLKQKGVSLLNQGREISGSQFKRDFLIAPSHGSGHFHATEKYSDLPKHYRELIGKADASVLLYYTEFCDSNIRKAWEESGFKIYCNGMAWGAENRTLWTYNGGRPGFLHHTLETLSFHSNVICQYPTTLAHYSTSLGIPTKISRAEETPRTLGIVSEGKGVERHRYYEGIADELGVATLGNDFDILNFSEEKSELAMQSLGIESLKSIEQLKSLLPLRSGLIPLPE